MKKRHLPSAHPRALPIADRTRSHFISSLRCSQPILSMHRVIFELAVQSSFADPEQSSGLQFIAVQLRNGTENGLLLQFGHGDDLVLTA